MEFWENDDIQEQVAQKQSAIKQEESSEDDGTYPELPPDEDFLDEEALLVAEEEADTELLSNARLRLEQGRLYEMLLKHDLFGDVEADPRATANVQKEMRNFIKERLEVLLGLRQDPKFAPQPTTEAASPFNSLEVELLKRFLAKMSKGVTEQAEAPAQRPSPKPQGGLKSLSSSKPISKPTPVAQSRPAQRSAPQAQPKQPLKKSEPASNLTMPSKTVKEQLEALGENEMPLGTTVDKVSKKALMERNLRISQRQAARKAQSTNKLPTPMGDQEQQIMMSHLMSRQQSMAQSGSTPVSLALAKVLSSKAGQSNDIDE